MKDEDYAKQRTANEEAARACAEAIMALGPAKTDTVRKLELESAFLRGAVYGVGLAKVKP